MIAEYASAFPWYFSLGSQADPTDFQSNPTLAAGDFKGTVDGAAEANLATLPTVTPASSRHVKGITSAAETTGKCFHVMGRDAAGAEWIARDWTIHTADHHLAQYPNGVVYSGLAHASSQTTSNIRLAADPGVTIKRGYFFLVTVGTEIGAAGYVLQYSTAGGEFNVTVDPNTLLDNVLDGTSNIKFYPDRPAWLTAINVRAAVGLAAANLDTQLDVLDNPAGFKKNTAVADFSWPMRDTDGNLVTGLTVTGEIQKDGGAYGALAGTIAEIGATGTYQVTTNPALTAGEMNADQIMLKFTAAGAKATIIAIYTEP